MREGAWVGRAPAGSGSGRHVEEGTWCCSNDDACRSAAPPIAPLPSRRVAASRGQYRWCGGGGSLHRPAAGAAITSMRGGCRRLVWLEAYAAPPKPYCRSSAWRLGRAAVVVADGIWRRRRRLALPSGRNSDPAALAGGGAYTLRPFSSTAIRACCAPAWCIDHHPRFSKVKDRRVALCRSAPTYALASKKERKQRPSSKYRRVLILRRGKQQ